MPALSFRLAVVTIIMLRRFIFLSFLVIVSFHSHGQVKATLLPDSTNIRIGEHLGVNLKVSFPKDVNVILPSFKDSLGTLEIVRIEKRDTSSVGNIISVAQKIIVSAYDSGMYRVGPQNILVLNNGKTDTISTDEFFVEVATVEVDTTQNFKPIKAPIEVPPDWKTYAMYALLALILIALGVLAWWLFKKYYKPQSKQEDPINRMKLAHVWALKELQKLEQEKLWQKDEVKQYYSRLTDIFRKYLEYRYNILALESTTEEIEQMLVRDDVPEKYKNEAINILKLSDLVKFAKMIPLPDQNKNAMEGIREFIKTTAWKEIPNAEQENKIPER
ncbi:MAG: hypothetical protein RMJ53_07275 [Chitinophagales bacterium]|nr:hypothetical protein [Chitinophagales bacterium]